MTRASLVVAAAAQIEAASNLLVEASAGQTLVRGAVLPPLPQFVAVLAARAKVPQNTLLCALVLVRRLAAKIRQPAKGLPCSRHRIFLASLIIAVKYNTDAPIKNKSWVPLAGNMFSIQEINLMERQLLSLLDYKVHITAKELFMALPLPSVSVGTSVGTSAESADSDALMHQNHMLRFEPSIENTTPPPTLQIPHVAPSKRRCLQVPAINTTIVISAAQPSSTTLVIPPHLSAGPSPAATSPMYPLSSPSSGSIASLTPSPLTMESNHSATIEPIRASSSTFLTVPEGSKNVLKRSATRQLSREWVEQELN
ncbi:hypothetical protein BCR33DRAFT_697317 [Rhizoclosmatium globosum]|uniref:Cyclin N-terminal domain-containing protein n=1 Tax=Rhizoclosmatium globosum TaxID=329046 RepID=A0A1Y2CDS5_9FUNG|nr:hypothetical protein BCR33DRAFT_697317 [Rhizoclosmatium globosum]|eukprot:ORY45193.1 hypothetical protein BCR33DRAFT_697317 [Rhizoclosmatium globosum]